MIRLSDFIPRGSRRLFRDRRGGIIAITALTMPVILVICAFSVDLGLLYLAKSRAETTAIFAAESGVRRMPDRVAAAALARDVGNSFLQDSGLTDGRIHVSTGVTTITVEVGITVTAIFSRMVGEEAMTAVARVTRAL